MKLDMKDDLVLVVGGRAINGWTSIQLTRGIERCPNDFVIAMTDVTPADSSQVAIRAGDPCKVYLGESLTVTGYVDRSVASFSPYGHTITVVGRGKCQDLIDCAAEWPGGQFSNVTAGQIAAGLAKPYGINVLMLDDPKTVLPQFNLMQGETAFEIIERVCRLQALLAYESPKGELVLSRVGKSKHVSGLHEGSNVESATAMHSVDQQYSEYHAYTSKFNVFNEMGDAGFLIEVLKNPYLDVARNRKRFILMEGGDAGQVVTKARLHWEMNRRYGRSHCVRVATDSWRDSSGALYEPNMLIDVNLPSLQTKASTWIVSEVVYRRDGASGTTCELLIMPPQAFEPEPILINKTLAELTSPPTN